MTAGDDAAPDDDAVRRSGVGWGHPQPRRGHRPAAKREGDGEGASQAIESDEEERRK
jgi:hypothetical protein